VSRGNDGDDLLTDRVHPSFVKTIFGVDWEQVQLDDIAGFLESAGSEPLTWEAKADGREALRADVVRNEICAFGNSELGGFLILGATQVEGRWALPGLQHPKSEIITWVSDAAGGVKPTPSIQTRDWPVERNRGQVALVWVPPVAEPPAITTDGLVFQRLPGQTSRVNDPRTLAGLFERGRAASTLAESLAKRTLANALALVPTESTSGLIAIFGFAATGHHRDISSVLFTSAMETRLKSVARKHLGRGFMARIPDVSQRQDGMWVTADGPADSGAAFVGWDGSIAVAILARDDIGDSLRRLASESDDAVSRAWGAASELLLECRATGRMFMVLKPSTIGGELDLSIEVSRWCDVGGPTDADVASVRRELQRAAGLFVLES
jgi:hypothetical protein